jgi:hypothetical protein
MFGKKAHHAQHDAVDATETPTMRDRVGKAVFHVLGPAAVEGALQGHSPEARAHWKSRVEANKRAREEARRQRQSDEAA